MTFNDPALLNCCLAYFLSQKNKSKQTFCAMTQNAISKQHLRKYQVTYIICISVTIALFFVIGPIKLWNEVTAIRNMVKHLMIQER